jgi:ABC-type transport system involved in multi-copper enzyme maturation permease subunit
MFSTFTTSTLAAIFSLSVYVIGHVSDDLMTMSEKFSGDPLGYLLKGLYYTLPNLGQFDIKGQVVHGIAVAPSYVMLTSCYALVYIAFLFVAATLIFQRRDFK